VQSIGRYQVIRQIAARDEAVVYLGLDPTSGRPVALKVIPPQSANNSPVWAQVEARAAALASLPAYVPAVPIEDIGEEAGSLYLVMPYLPGGTLAERLAAGPLESTALIASIVERVGQALDEGYRRGLVHGNLKPSNVLFDKQGRAYLTDFCHGPADPAVEPNGVDGSPTRAGDIYALGLLLRQMLESRVPVPRSPTDRTADQPLTGTAPPLAPAIDRDQRDDGSPAQRRTRLLNGPGGCQIEPRATRGCFRFPGKGNAVRANPERRSQRGNWSQSPLDRSRSDPALGRYR
jgi:serine/threonine-protein kinase